MRKDLATQYYVKQIIEVKQLIKEGGSERLQQRRHLYLKQCEEILENWLTGKNDYLLAI